MTSAGSGARRTGRPCCATSLLTVGALVMVTPFLYMLSTSFKSAALRADQLPPQFIPNPATPSATTRRAWNADNFAPLLPATR